MDVLARPLYLRPDLEAEIARLELGEEDARLVRGFAECGFAIIDLQIPDFDSLAQRILAEVAPHLRPDGDGKPRLQDGWRVSAACAELAANARVLDVLRLLYGREPFPFQTLNFAVGTEQSTHSDTIHFDSVPAGFMAGVWVALEDVDAGNGPVHYYPGSHRLPHLTLADFGAAATARGGAYRAYREVYERGMRQLAEASGMALEEAHLAKGNAFIWAANLLHGGSPIRDGGRTRHSQVTHYYFADCAYFTPMLSDPLLGRVEIREPCDIRTGRRVVGRYSGRPVRRPLIRRLWERARSGLRG